MVRPSQQGRRGGGGDDARFEALKKRTAAKREAVERNQAERAKIALQQAKDMAADKKAKDIADAKEFARIKEMYRGQHPRWLPSKIVAKANDFLMHKKHIKREKEAEREKIRVMAKQKEEDRVRVEAFYEKSPAEPRTDPSAMSAAEHGAVWQRMSTGNRVYSPDGGFFGGVPFNPKYHAARVKSQQIREAEERERDQRHAVSKQKRDAIRQQKKKEENARRDAREAKKQLLADEVAAEQLAKGARQAREQLLAEEAAALQLAEKAAALQLAKGARQAREQLLAEEAAALQLAEKAAALQLAEEAIALNDSWAWPAQAEARAAELRRTQEAYDAEVQRVAEKAREAVRQQSAKDAAQQSAEGAGADQFTEELTQLVPRQVQAQGVPWRAACAHNFAELNLVADGTGGCGSVYQITETTVMKRIELYIRPGETKAQAIQEAQADMIEWNECMEIAKSTLPPQFLPFVNSLTDPDKAELVVGGWVWIESDSSRVLYMDNLLPLASTTIDAYDKQRSSTSSCLPDCTHHITVKLLVELVKMLLKNGLYSGDLRGGNVMLQKRTLPGFYKDEAIYVPVLIDLDSFLLRTHRRDISLAFNVFKSPDCIMTKDTRETGEVYLSPLTIFESTSSHGIVMNEAFLKYVTCAGGLFTLCQYIYGKTYTMWDIRACLNLDQYAHGPFQGKPCTEPTTKFESMIYPALLAMSNVPKLATWGAKSDVSALLCTLVDLFSTFLTLAHTHNATVFGLGSRGTLSGVPKRVTDIASGFGEEAAKTWNFKLKAIMKKEPLKTATDVREYFTTDIVNTFIAYQNRFSDMIDADKRLTPRGAELKAQLTPIVDSFLKDEYYRGREFVNRGREFVNQSFYPTRQQEHLDPFSTSKTIRAWFRPQEHQLVHYKERPFVSLQTQIMGVYNAFKDHAN